MRASVLLVFLALVSAAEAQTDVFPNLWITDARVEGIAILGDTVFVAGRFDYVGPPTGQLAVLDKTTGEADLSQLRFSAFTSLSIQAIEPDGTGGYYVAGQFAVVSGQVRRGLARVLADGTLDPDFRPDPVLSANDNGFVGELALDGGVLYLAGRFNTVGGQPRRDLAAVDATTGAVLPFDGAIGGGSSGIFQIFELHANAGVVYVGGRFTTVAGQHRPNAVALDGVTGALLPWAVTTSAPVLPLGFGDGTVYIDGAFASVNGQPRPGTAEVALYDPATGGGALTAWTPSERLFGPNAVVTERYIWAPDINRPALTRADRASGAVTVVFVPGVTNGWSAAYDPSGGPNGTLYLGGQGVNPDGEPRYPVVVGIDAVTAQPTGFRVYGATETNRVNALAVEPGPDGRILAGGDFLTLGAGVERRLRLAAFDLTTGLPTDFAAGRTTVGANEDLALSPDGRFLYGFTNAVGGAILDLTEFDLVTGTTRQFTTSRPEPRRMSAPERTAALSAPAPRTCVNPRVENSASALVVTDDGAGGGRVCVALSGVVCFDRTTTEVIFSTPFSTFNGQGENNGDLLYLPPGGPIVGAGGSQGTLFLAAPIERSGTPDLRRPALAAVDYATGDVIASWEPGFDFLGAEGYSAVLLDPDGEGPQPASLYAGGDREWTVRGQLRSSLAAFDPATAALSPWAPDIAGGAILTLAAQTSPQGGPDGGASGVIYAGGSFRFVEGVLVPESMAAFDAQTGAYLSEWTAGPGVAFVSLVSVQHEAVFAGGLTGLLGSGREHLAAVRPARPLLPTAGESVAEAPAVRASLALAGPNPLRSRTTLAVSLPEAQAVEVGLYDVLGRHVAALHAGALPAGVSRIEVDASGLPAGVYVVRASGLGVA